ncbi:hypothetical protein FCN23_09405, partial [Campylobacter jejuni]
MNENLRDEKGSSTGQAPRKVRIIKILTNLQKRILLNGENLDENLDEWENGRRKRVRIDIRKAI